MGSYDMGRPNFSRLESGLDLSTTPAARVYDRNEGS